MTTIAYRDGVIVSDSLVLSGNEMVVGSTIKIISATGILAGASGNCADCHTFLEWAKKGADFPGPKFENGLKGILIKDNQQYYVGKDGVPFPVKAKFMASGSGEEMAMGAMCAGATAEAAVKIAIELDVFTGGEIRTLKL